MMEGRYFYPCAAKCGEGLVSVPGMPCLSCRIKAAQHGKQFRRVTFQDVVMWFVTGAAIIAILGLATIEYWEPLTR